MSLVKGCSFDSFIDRLVLEHMALEPGIRTNITENIAKLSGVAFFVIGCIGAAGILPGSTIGWLAIGLSGGAFLFYLAGGKLKERKITLLILAVDSLIPVVLGTLGVTGILSGAQVGWGIVGGTLVTVSIMAPILCRVNLKLQERESQ